MDNSIDQAA